MRIQRVFWIVTGLIFSVVMCAEAQFFTPPPPFDPPQKAMDYVAKEFSKAIEVEWKGKMKGCEAVLKLEPAKDGKPAFDAIVYFNDAGDAEYTLWNRRKGIMLKDSIDPKSVKLIEADWKNRSNFFDKNWLRVIECKECYIEKKTKKPVGKAIATQNIEGVAIYDLLGNFVKLIPKVPDL